MNTAMKLCGLFLILLAFVIIWFCTTIWTNAHSRRAQALQALQTCPRESHPARLRRIYLRDIAAGKCVRCHKEP
jgi:hypothetical protein